MDLKQGAQELARIQAEWYNRYSSPAHMLLNRPGMVNIALSSLGKLDRPQQLLKEAQSRHPEWKVKRLDND